MIQIEFYLPPPLTAAEAASIIGRLGGQARARQVRGPILAKAAEIRRELNMPRHPALEI